LRNAYHTDTTDFHLSKRTKYLLYSFHTMSSSQLALDRNPARCKAIAVLEEMKEYQG